MKNIFFIFITLCIPIFFVLVFIMGTYNKLVTLRNRFKNACTQLDRELKRRYDLIPNLVETAKGCLRHEHGTLEAVIAARKAASSASNRAAASPGNPAAMKELVSAEEALNESLGRLLALSEAYPDLTASTTMKGLLAELTSTENKVSFSGQAYNDSVMLYNTERESFPSNIIARMFHFAAAERFQIKNKAKKESPKVSST